jgi:hypothetical protein
MKRSDFGVRAFQDAAEGKQAPVIEDVQGRPDHLIPLHS